MRGKKELFKRMYRDEGGRIIGRPRKGWRKKVLIELQKVEGLCGGQGKDKEMWLRALRYVRLSIQEGERYVWVYGTVLYGVVWDGNKENWLRKSFEIVDHKSKTRKIYIWNLFVRYDYVFQDSVWIYRSIYLYTYVLTQIYNTKMLKINTKENNNKNKNFPQCSRRWVDKI